jgi:hypothetical protein
MSKAKGRPTGQARAGATTNNGGSGPARVRPPEVPDTGAGGGLIATSWAATALFALTAAGAAAWPSVFDVPALVVAIALFFAGMAVFAWAYFAAVARSRQDDIAVSSLFLLSGSAPLRVRRHLLGSLAAQVGAALATAGIRPFTSLAFGVLAPLFGLAMAGLWAARHGTFPPRDTAGRRPRPT